MTKGNILQFVFAVGVIFTVSFLQEGSASSEHHEDGYCVFYDHCTRASRPKPCVYNGRAKPVNDSRSLQILRELCPWLVAPEGETTYTCCDGPGLEVLLTSVQPAQQTLDRCPSCFRNFLNLLCSTTCSPNQSTFMNVTDSSNSTFRPGKKSVEAVSVHLEDDFAQGMYNACKDVNFPSTNEKVMTLYCGQYGAEHCSAQRFLDYLGDTNNGQTPYQFDYHLHNTSAPAPSPFVALNMTIHPCYKGVGNSSEPCSCQDCPRACPHVVPPPPSQPPCKIGALDCFTFYVLMSLVTFVIVFTGLLILHSLVLSPPARSEKKADLEVGCLESIGEFTEGVLRVSFQKIGRFVAWNPFPVLFLSVIVVIGLTLGMLMITVITDPVELWSPPESEARLQKEYFDDNFGPFYRTEQLIIQAPNTNASIYSQPPFGKQIPFGPVLDKSILHQVLDLQDAIASLTVYYHPEKRNITLEDICYAPLAPENKNCTILSVLNYFQNDHDTLDYVYAPWFSPLADYRDHLMFCESNPTAQNDTSGFNASCMGTYGGPVYPWTALAGYDGQNYNNATILIITFPVVNYKIGDPRIKRAEAWEAAYLRFMKDYSNENLSIAYQAERSVEDEIERESTADIITIAVSYLVMFAYVSIALGQFSFSVERWLIDSKIILGLCGVVIVFCSVASAVGALSYFGVPATLIVIEVVPFLVLAVGVDNIFILVQTYQREYRLGETRFDLISRVLGEVGPSMLLTSSSESVAFYLGALSDMPAVKAFSLYAATAVLFNFLLQITCFVALLSLDALRQEQNRFEVICCFRNKKAGERAPGPGLLQQVVENIYAPILLHRVVRWFVMIVFSFCFFASISFLPKISIGLDQTLAMPKDSYMLDYFNMELNYLNVGPPVYFVVKDGYNYSALDNQDKVCGTAGCNPDSLTAQIYLASEQSAYQHIAHPASSWIDDYFDWSKSSDMHHSCCRVYPGTETFCPASVDNDTCVACRNSTGRPSPQEFDEYLPFFLEDVPGIECAKGGKAAYSGAVSFKPNTTEVHATYFMTYHTICRNSSDYITAIERSRNISSNITRMLKKSTNIDNEEFEVYPYSIFYVFYEQYLTMYRNAVINLSVCTGAIFVITFLLLGCDLFSALICTFTITMITVDLMGVMYLWGIELNAISLVNLVMSVGISVEFCSHITRAFAMSIKSTRVERAHHALAHIGSSVLSGITLTKALGIMILYFSSSQLFQVYYFRMYLSIVILGGTHGLIFLPVLLSYIGPSVNKARLQKAQIHPTGSDSEQSPLLSDSSIQGESNYNTIHA